MVRSLAHDTSALVVSSSRRLPSRLVDVSARLARRLPSSSATSASLPLSAFQPRSDAGQEHSAMPRGAAASLACSACERVSPRPTISSPCRSGHAPSRRAETSPSKPASSTSSTTASVWIVPR
eukprot:1409244-Prymnesium_polylepis.1